MFIFVFRLAWQTKTDRMDGRMDEMRRMTDRFYHSTLTFVDG